MYTVILKIGNMIFTFNQTGVRAMRDILRDNNMTCHMSQAMIYNND